MTTEVALGIFIAAEGVVAGVPRVGIHRDLLTRCLCCKSKRQYGLTTAPKV